MLLQVNGGGRIFKIGDDDSPLDVTIRDISVRYGNVYGSEGESGLGGAIYVSDNVNLTIQDSFLTENQARGGEGGGSGLGGAIYVGNNSNLDLVGRVELYLNTVIAGTGGDASGAAIYMAGPTGELRLAPTAGSTIVIGNDLGNGSPDDTASQRLIIDGAGKVNLAAASGYSGATIIEFGTLDIGRYGSLLNSDIQVESDGILTGGGFTPGEASGTGAVTVFSGGTLNPGWTGDSSGPTTAVFRTGSLTLFSGATLAAEIAGATTPGAYSLPGMIVGLDQVLVNGTVSLGGATLNLYTSRSNTIGASYALIDNDGVDAVVGTFAGLQEGAKFTTGSLAYGVTYTGGDGNDVVVTRIDNTAPVSGDASISTVEDTAKVLALGDFGPYSDAESGAIAAVKIVSLPTNGTLQYFDGEGWSAATGDQEISAPEIAAGHVRFLPDSGESGDLYATLSFKVGDGASFSANAYALTVHVTPEIVAPGELVANGGFESITPVEHGDNEIAIKYDNWVLGGENVSTDVSPDDNRTHSGSYVAAFSGVSADVTLSQDIPTTTGEHYTLSFWLANGDWLRNGESADPTDNFSVSWNGNLIPVDFDVVTGYTYFEFDVVGNNGQSELQFASLNPPDYWLLDDVSVREGVDPGNDAPVPANDYIIMASDDIYFGPGGARYIAFPLDFLAVNDDPDGGDTFTSAYNVENYGFSATTPLGASVGLGSNGVFYQLAANQSSTFEDSFTYDISNDGQGNGTGHPATVTLTVTDSLALAGDALLDRSEIIVGGLFSETMTGHGGADGFVFLPAPGRDTIADFTPGVDKIVIANFDPLTDTGMSVEEAAFLLHPDEGTFAAWKTEWTTDSHGVTFALHYDGDTPIPSATDTVTLANVDPASLHASDFIVHNIAAT